MSMTDPVADLLTQIRNAQMANHEAVEVPYSKVREGIVTILQEEGYVEGYKTNEKKPFRTLTVRLKYIEDRKPAIQILRKVSKPGRRIYVGRDEIPPVLGGLGINILSTSKGLLSGKKARQEGVGGELLCEVY